MCAHRDDEWHAQFVFHCVPVLVCVLCERNQNWRISLVLYLASLSAAPQWCGLNYHCTKQLSFTRSLDWQNTRTLSLGCAMVVFFLRFIPAKMAFIRVERNTGNRVNLKPFELHSRPIQFCKRCIFFETTTSTTWIVSLKRCKIISVRLLSTKTKDFLN